MSIFSQPSHSKGTAANTTHGFYLGSTEAEAEINSGKENLAHYFDDYLSVLPDIQNGKFIVTGRKGSGKSAIAKYILDLSEKSAPNSYCKVIKANDLQIEQISQTSDLEEIAKSGDFDSMIFEWIILVRIIELIVKSNSAKYTRELGAMKRFLEINSGMVNIDKYAIKEREVTDKRDITFEGMKNIFSATFEKYFNSKTVKAPFYRLINPLKEIVHTVLQFPDVIERDFILIFDDLDIGFYEESLKSINRVTELLRSAKVFNTEIFVGSKAKILILLRDDIKHVILKSRAADTAKLFTSYEVNLNWYDHDIFKMDEDQIKLKRLINRRIKINFEERKINFDTNDPWGSLIENYDDYSSDGNRTSFKYIIDFTFFRPRDLLLFFKPISAENYVYPLKASIVKNLLHKFFTQNVYEIKNELSIFFDANELGYIFNILRDNARNSRLTCTGLETALKEYQFQKSPKEIIKILFDHSILGFKDSSYGTKLYFYYRENFEWEVLLSQNLDLTLHKSMYHYFVPNQL